MEDLEEPGWSLVKERVSVGGASSSQRAGH